MEVCGWVSRWSLEAPFPSRIGDGGSLWMGVTVLMRIGDGSLRFGHGRFRDLRFGHGRFRDLREGVDERWV